MRVLTLNFSPKGDLSITKQYYLHAKHVFERKYHFSDKDNNDNFVEDINLAKDMNIFIKDEKYRASVISKVEAADMIIFLSPVYAYTLPPQLKKFIDISVAGNIDIFKNKFMFCFISSGKVHDDVAINDFYSICEKVNGSGRTALSLDMELKNNPDASKYIERFVDYNMSLYDVIKNGKSPDGVYKTIVVTDTGSYNDKLQKVIDSLPVKPEILDLTKYKLNYCLGDLACTMGDCIYKNDQFLEVFDKMNEAKVVILNFEDPNMSDSFRTVFSRALSVGQHHESLPNKQILCVNYGNSYFVNEWVYSYADMQACHLVGIVTSKTADDELKYIVAKSFCALKNEYLPYETCLRKGSFILFNNLIKRKGFALVRDIEYLEKHGKRSVKVKFFYLLSRIFKIKPIRNLMVRNMPSILIADFAGWRDRNKLN